ncbi:hypothetical protein FHW67_001049 [Herbaspirillum sp. Sphag1AN]|uniref:hypothetical protein n=1 Tax=unclassified Herbaspirillum TaxID=2624150 RepID=UPI001615D20B|nr:MULTISPECIES: hypothetical protein [unclassified Herbaspirillum]MBB3211781.1 hypothetical protein [Herbaspirillum sp. Sphag1AN]MBB3244385.1 hypothetical protein [Herbaspirillum sp. Sphag64]
MPTQIVGVSNRPAERTEVASETSLCNADMLLSRSLLQQTLSTMVDRAYQSVELSHSGWIRALRIYPHQQGCRSSIPETVVLLKSLRQHLADSSAATLDIRETAFLSLRLEKLAQLLSTKTMLGELCERLSLHAQASWAYLARAEVQRQLLPQFQQYDRPGSYDKQQLGLSLGAALGISGGISNQFSLKLGGTHHAGIENDDEAYVLQTYSKSLSARLGITADVGMASLSAGADVQLKKTFFREYNSGKVFLRLNAEKLQYGSRRATLGHGRGSLLTALISKVYPGYGNELRHFRSLQQRAADQQQRLAVLLGWLGQRDVSAGLPGVRSEQTLSGQARGVRVTANVQSDAALWHGAASAAKEHADVRMEILKPYWQALSAAQGAARNPDMAAQRLALIGQRAQALFDRPTTPSSSNRQKLVQPLSRLTGLVGCADPAADPLQAMRDCAPEVLHEAATRLRAEFEHFCAVVQQQDAGIARHQGIERVFASFAASWQGKRREDVLANMALAHAALLSVAHARTDTGMLEQVLKQMAEQLYQPAIRHDAQTLAARVAFRDILQIQTSERSYALDLGNSSVVPSGAMALSLTERKRLHPNPLRAGDYRDVAVRFSLGVLEHDMFNHIKEALSVCLVRQQLPLDLSSLDGLSSVLQGQVSGNATLLLRFYRPQYQQDAGFAPDATGYRLQLVRLVSGMTIGADISADIPVQPGVELKLGLQAQTMTGRVLFERWGHNTLTAPMMHYLHLLAVDEHERWQALCQAQQKALSGLFCRLADARSAVHKEARYFLARQAQDDFDVAFFATMRGFDQRTVSFAQAQSALGKLLQRQYPLWQQDKLTFPGRIELAK